MAPIIHPLPVLGDNYSYLILDDSDTRTAIVVDPGDGAAIHKRLLSLGCTIDAILVTHHHLDHVAGIEELCSGGAVNVVAHASEMNRVPKANTAVHDGERITVGTFTIHVLHVPGHTRGHVAYLLGENLFTGDALFLGGCGRLFEGTAAEMFHSLNSRIRVLPDTVLIYPGHEYTVRTRSFSLSVDTGNVLLSQKLEEARSLQAHNMPTVPGDLHTEKLSNVFLRCDAPEVVAQVQKHHPGLPDDPISIFRQLRTMMDTF